MSRIISVRIISGSPGQRGLQGLPSDLSAYGPQGITIQGPEGEIGNPGPTCACRLDQDVQDTRATGAQNQDFLTYSSGKFSRESNPGDLSEVDFSNLQYFESSINARNDLSEYTPYGIGNTIHLRMPEIFYAIYQEISYSDFSDISKFTLNGDAKQLDNDTLEISSGTGTNFGSAWFDDVAAIDDFSTFISLNPHGGLWGGGFAIQNSPDGTGAEPNTGGFDNFAVATHSLSISTSVNTDNNRLRMNIVGRNSSGTKVIDTFPGGVSIMNANDPNPFNFWVNWTKSSKLLEIWWVTDGSEIKPGGAPNFTLPDVDIEDLLDSDRGIIGFSAASTTDNNTNTIQKWDYNGKFFL